MTSIRPRRGADLDACIDVLKHVHAKDKYPVQGTSEAESFLSNPSVIQAWVAERDGQVMGHVAVSKATDEDVSVALWWRDHPGDRIALVERLFVHPAARGGGLAHQLVDATIGWSRENESRLVLFALKKDETASRLYGRLGFTEFGRTTYRWGGNHEMEAICFVSPVSSS